MLKVLAYDPGSDVAVIFCRSDSALPSVIFLHSSLPLNPHTTALTPCTCHHWHARVPAPAPACIFHPTLQVVLGSSSASRPGDFVVAMGSPARLANTGTTTCTRIFSFTENMQLLLARKHAVIDFVILGAVTCGVLSAVDRSLEEIDESFANSSSTRQVKQYQC